jgi:uncharacterized membrane protein
MRCTIWSRTDLSAWLGVALGLSYPALLYLGRQAWPPYVSALILVLLAWLWRLRAGALPVGRGLGWATLLLAAAAVALGDTLPLKFYPVLVNAVLLAVFGASLWFPPPVVERIARLRHPDLPPEGVAYTRRVTRIWCGFFLGNGSLALWTTLYGSDRAWFWYNGVIAYLLIGSLFAGEWLVRRRLLGVEHG